MQMVVHCRTFQVTVSRSMKPAITSKLHRKINDEEKSFHKLVLKPLRNHCKRTLQHIVVLQQQLLFSPVKNILSTDASTAIQLSSSVYKTLQ